MDPRFLVLFAMVVLPIALFVWSRRRRGPGMDPATARAGYEAVRAGAPLTDHLIRAVAAYTVQNAYNAEGVVEEVLTNDHYMVRLSDGSRVRGARSMPLWRRGIVLTTGQRVSLLAVRGGDLASIRATL